MSVKKKVLIAVLAVAVLVGAGFGIFKLITMGNDGKSKESAVYVQRVSEITGKGLWGQVNRYAGTVESPESWSYSLRSGGKVKEVFVKVGDSVERGQKLLVYDTTEEESAMAEAKIELERMEAEIEKSKKNIETLEDAVKKAKEADKAPLQIELENEKLELKKAQMQIDSKKKEIENLNAYTESPEVKSKMAGVVTALNNNTSDYYYDENGNDAFLTIVKVGDFRIKASVNEMNINDVAENVPVIVTSRVDGTAWYGIIDSIERDHPSSYEERGQDSSTYPFYVTLDDCEGLMLGQHVYVEVDRGQNDTTERTGLWISDSYIVDADTDTPYVFVDNGSGVLERRAVTLGERDEALLQSQITAGISGNDLIALPMSYVREGMPTSTDISAMQNHFDEPGDTSAPSGTNPGVDPENFEGEGFGGEGYQGYEGQESYGDLAGMQGYGNYEGFAGMDGFGDLSGQNAYGNTEDYGYTDDNAGANGDDLAVQLAGGDEL